MFLSSSDLNVPVWLIPKSSNVSIVLIKPLYPLSMLWLFDVVKTSIPKSWTSFASWGGELNVGYPLYALFPPANVVSKFPTAISAFDIYDFICGKNVEKSYFFVEAL